MDWLKKHFFLALYVVLMMVGMILNLNGWYLVLGTFAYLILYALIKLPKTVAFIGYFLQAGPHKYDAAFACYEYAYKKGGVVPGPMLAYGIQLLERSQYEKALKVMQDVLVAPGLTPTLLQIARQDTAYGYWKTGDLDTAISTMELMREDYDILDADFFTALGFLYIEKGDFEKADAVTQEALREQADSGPAYDNLGMIAYKQGNYEEAKELFDKAIELKDNMASTKYYLGLLAERDGDTEAARDYFEAALRCPITGLNVIAKETIEEKLKEYRE